MPNFILALFLSISVFTSHAEASNCIDIFESDQRAESENHRTKVIKSISTFLQISSKLSEIKITPMNMPLFEENKTPQILFVWAAENESDLESIQDIVNTAKKYGLRTLGLWNFNIPFQYNSWEKSGTMMGVALEGWWYQLLQFGEKAKGIKYFRALNTNSDSYKFSRESEKWINFEPAVEKLRWIITTYGIQGTRAEHAALEFLEKIIQDSDYKALLISMLGEDLTNFDSSKQLLGRMFIRHYELFKKIISRILPNKKSYEATGFKFKIKLETYSEQPMINRFPLTSNLGANLGDRIYFYQNVLLQWREIAPLQSEAMILLSKKLFLILNDNIQTYPTRLPNVSYVNGINLQRQANRGRQRNYRIYYVKRGKEILVLDITPKEKYNDDASLIELQNRYQQLLYE